MTTPLEGGCNLPRKSKATSCTSCRQVKLKCDLRQTYPGSCTRCERVGRLCNTDPAFRRVPTRRRIQDLESQIRSLKQDRDAAAVSSTHSLASTHHTEPPQLSTGQTDDSIAMWAKLEDPVQVDSLRPDLGTTNDASLGSTWLSLADDSDVAPFALEGHTLAYIDALELFWHFEDRYYPDFCIVEPVTSLHQLHEQSPFLFWSIISVASRNHHRHMSLFESVKPGLSRLQAAVLDRAIDALLDLQGVLLACAFPYNTICEGQPDYSWVLLGSAINAAKHLGLQPSSGEMSSSRCGLQHTCKHSLHVRRLTWLKCFELDVQMSSWQGHVPTLVSEQSVCAVAALSSSLASVGYAAVIDVHAELARGLADLESVHNAPDQPLATLIRLSVSRLDAVKCRWWSAWNTAMEFELLTAKLHIHAIGLERSQSAANADESLYVEMLRAGARAAERLATLASAVNLDARLNAGLYGFHRDQHPFPGHTKQHMRGAFLSAVMLLNYLNEADTDNVRDKEPAVRAFAKTFEIFAESTSTNAVQSTNVVRIFEAASRNVNNRCNNICTYSATHLGSSSGNHAAWASDQVRTLDHNVAPLVPSMPRFVSATNISSTKRQSYNPTDPTAILGTDELAFTEPIWSPSIVGVADAIPSVNPLEGSIRSEQYQWLVQS